MPLVEEASYRIHKLNSPVRKNAELKMALLDSSNAYPDSYEIDLSSRLALSWHVYW
jgi:hypothetical protein